MSLSCLAATPLCRHLGSVSPKLWLSLVRLIPFVLVHSWICSVAEEGHEGRAHLDIEPRADARDRRALARLAPDPRRGVAERDLRRQLRGHDLRGDRRGDAERIPSAAA